MPYTPTVWTNSVGPTGFTIVDPVTGTICTNATITPVGETAGTPLNATNLNKIETGIQTAQATAEAAVPKSLATAIGQIFYSTASSVLAALVKPAFTAILQMTSAGTPSWRAIKQPVQVQVVAETSDVDTGTGVAYFFVPSTMDGMNLVRATAFVLTAGTTNPTTVQIRNLTKYASNDALSVAISIASGGTIATAGTINTTYDDVSTNDKIKIYVTGQSITKPKGLIVVLEYQLP